MDEKAIRAARGPWAGTEGHLDAPYWQSSPAVVEAMLDLAQLQPGERLLDLGCGDGRIAIAAARRGACGIGVDIDPLRIAEAQAAASAAGLEVCFRREDMFETPLDEVSVVTLYLLTHVNNLLADRLRAELSPGARIVSHHFSLRGWTPTAEALVEGRPLFLWRV